MAIFGAIKSTVLHVSLCPYKFNLFCQGTPMMRWKKMNQAHEIGSARSLCTRNKTTHFSGLRRPYQYSSEGARSYSSRILGNRQRRTHEPDCHAAPIHSAWSGDYTASQGTQGWCEPHELPSARMWGCEVSAVSLARTSSYLRVRTTWPRP